MQKSIYFETVVKNLEEDSCTDLDKHTPVCFSTLKILEYWARILTQNPESVNRQVAFRLMNETALRSMIEQVSALISKAVIEDNFDQALFDVDSKPARKRPSRLRCHFPIAEVVNDYKKTKSPATTSQST